MGKYRSATRQKPSRQISRLLCVQSDHEYRGDRVRTNSLLFPAVREISSARRGFGVRLRSGMPIGMAARGRAKNGSGSSPLIAHGQKKTGVWLLSQGARQANWQGKNALLRRVK